jgi:septal ring factor EnvC (AmiA/AmiB activator)
VRRLSLIAALFLAFSFLFIGFAATASDIDRRVDEMHKRINQGVQSGELTQQEAAGLRQELNDIRKDEARMRADGRLTRPEIDRLNGELDRLSRDIYREKHDQDTVGGRNINQRVSEMHKRINQGVKSGELTRQEATRLRQELNNIRGDEARMRADGRLTRPEIDRLNGELDRLSRDIYREKHDQESRPR